jgi:hypothetical protein
MSDIGIPYVQFKHYNWRCILVPSVLLSLLLLHSGWRELPRQGGGAPLLYIHLELGPYVNRAFLTPYSLSYDKSVI